jgi:SAM-dependent methyltransferase
MIFSGKVISLEAIGRAHLLKPRSRNPGMALLTRARRLLVRAGGALYARLARPTPEERRHQAAVHRRWEAAYRATPASLLPWEREGPEPELVRVVRARRLPRGSAVLDVACGQGRDAVWLASQGYRATGLDISETALARARERARAAGVRARFVRGNAWRLYFRPGSFSLVNDRGGFHHIPEDHRREYVEGLARVLRPRGLLLVQAFSARNPWRGNTFTRAELVGHFAPRFEALEGREVLHREAVTREPVYLWSVLFRRRG